MARGRGNTQKSETWKELKGGAYGLFGDDAELAAGVATAAGKLERRVARGHAAAQDHVHERAPHAADYSLPARCEPSPCWSLSGQSKLSELTSRLREEGKTKMRVVYYLRCVACLSCFAGPTPLSSSLGLSRHVTV
jgi:hypothetical protein